MNQRKPNPCDLPPAQTYKVTLPKPRPAIDGKTTFAVDFSNFDRNFAEIFGGAP